VRVPDKHPSKLQQAEAFLAPGPDHYREFASQLRELSRRCPFPHARREIARLAVKLDGRAERLQKGWAL
jgi:hypothetical protein